MKPKIKDVFTKDDILLNHTKELRRPDLNIGECWIHNNKPTDKAGHISLRRTRDLQNLSIRSGKGATYRAHRVTYELWHNPIPNNTPCVCHTCDIPNCVNPNHLWLGTTQDNTADRDRKGRGAKGPDPRKASKGSTNGRAQLSEKDAKFIRYCYKRFKASQDPDKSSSALRAQLSKRYNVSDGTIQDIMYGRTWKHIS